MHAPPSFPLGRTLTYPATRPTPPYLFLAQPTPKTPKTRLQQVSSQMLTSPVSLARYRTRHCLFVRVDE
ncbi:hypothetical protein K458DRAFT_115720 [Lentithecium fluviatile CBS 122367]|uniref:Uncharacterized protein n=1 Tax=Lentithecium fluviatile CBS 122367 TaxID=1168545 RepID=A0A6G1INI4_9PLEO|nr:hypothetical protein K458DRAFT_115720 [Lentithecium fluviatile CBS 122367]